MDKRIKYCDSGWVDPSLITSNVTKRPRTIAEMAQAKGLTPAAVRTCMRRLGEADRVIVRPLDELQETWEISHDFLVPLLDAIVARRTVSLWRRARPLMPWAAAAIIALVALAIPPLAKPGPTLELTKQGWTVSQRKEGVTLTRNTEIPPESIPLLRTLPPPYSLDLADSNVTDISALRELKGLTTLSLFDNNVVDISALRELKGLTKLDLGLTHVADISALRELMGLTTLDLRGAKVKDADVVALRRPGLRIIQD